jgi:hypothetical protein
LDHKSSKRVQTGKPPQFVVFHFSSAGSSTCRFERLARSQTGLELVADSMPSRSSGFIVIDFASQKAEFERDMAAWLRLCGWEEGAAVAQTGSTAENLRDGGAFSGSARRKASFGRERRTAWAAGEAEDRRMKRP